MSISQTEWVVAIALGGAFLAGCAGLESAHGGQFMFAANADPIYLPEPPEVPRPTVVEIVPRIERYDDGSVKIRGEVRVMSDDSRVNHGKYIEFYANGKTFKEGSYENGIQQKEWKYWYDNGQECKIVNYRNGVPHGSWEVFREDGTKQYARGYSTGKRHGKWLVYADDGETVLWEQNFVDGKPDGVWYTWFDDGKKRAEHHFKDGARNGPTLEWDKDGRLVKEFNFLDGKRHGTNTSWTLSGGKIVAEYERGKLITESKVEGEE